MSDKKDDRKENYYGCYTKKRVLTVVLSNHLQITVVVHGNFVLIFNQNIFNPQNNPTGN